MNARHLTVALSLGAVLALAGCGGADEPTAVDAGSDPTTAAATTDAGTASGDTPTSSGDLPEAAWAADCSPSTTSLDYNREPRGWKTPEEAVEHAGNLGLPPGTLVLSEGQSHEPMSVLVVDDATQTILAAVSVFQGSTGFYVDGVTTCG